MIRCLVDGQPADSVPIDDRGLLYGDALFETIAFHDGLAPLWPLHWQRLEHGGRRLGIKLPEEQRLLEDCRRLAPSERFVVIRLSVTRGSGGRAYFPDLDKPSRTIVQARDWPANLDDQRRTGLAVVTASVTLASGSMLAGLKHANRLEQVLAARECAAAGADEALVCDNQGCLAEAIASNLIVEFGSRAVTPISESGVEGVGLAWLQDQPEVALDRASLSRADLDSATGLMVINSVAGIRPVHSLDGRRLKISDRCRAWQLLWNRRLG